MADNAQKVVATAGLITVATGSINSLGKSKKLPSARFLIGCGTAFFILSALAEAEPDLAKALAIAVTTTVVLGEGGGALSYLDKHGETDTRRAPVTPKEVPAHPVSTDYGSGAVNRASSLETLTPIPGLASVYN